MKTNKKERIFYYNLLRAFDIIAVIICHVEFYFGSIVFPIEEILRMTFHDIGRIGVPIFLMVSGALLLNRNYPSQGDFLKRRFTRIIYPAILDDSNHIDKLLFPQDLFIHVEYIHWNPFHHVVFLDPD